MAQEKLTQMKLCEECKDNLLPPCLSAMVQKQQHMDVDSDSDKCFDLWEADHLGSDLDSGFKVLKAAKPKAKVRI